MMGETMKRLGNNHPWLTILKEHWSLGIFRPGPIQNPRRMYLIKSLRMADQPLDAPMVVIVRRELNQFFSFYVCSSWNRSRVGWVAVAASPVIGNGVEALLIGDDGVSWRLIHLENNAAFILWHSSFGPTVGQLLSCLSFKTSHSSFSTKTRFETAQTPAMSYRHPSAFQFPGECERRCSWPQ